jgi:predicted regulator of Ras-like GTPase activity (Roadblock/LC7/MglB family)
VAAAQRGELPSGLDVAARLPGITRGVATGVSSVSLHMSTSGSVIPPSQLGTLEGSVALTSVPDILQFLHLGRQSGELRLVNTDTDRTCKVYLHLGEVVHVDGHDARGIAALVDALDWKQGYFRFRREVNAPAQSLELPFQHLIMEVLRLNDERNKHLPMAETKRESSDVLQELLKVPGVNAVVVVGRDGFLIESAGHSASVDLDSIGASLAHAINGVEEMGSDLAVERFTDVFIEYKRAVIMCSPIGDAIVALVSPDASKLGIIRHKARKCIEELASFF